MNPFKVLGIEDKSEAKKAYRELSKKYHPDKPGGNTEKFKTVKTAYEMIKEGKTKKNVYESQDEDLFKNYFSQGRRKKKKHNIKVKLKDIINEKNLNLRINNKKIKLRLNRGMKNGSAVRIEGHTFNIKIVSEEFKIKGDDLIYPITINYVQALVGVKVKVPSLLKGESPDTISTPVNCKDKELVKTNLTGFEKGNVYLGIKVVPPGKDFSSKIQQVLDED